MVLQDCSIIQDSKTLTNWQKIWTLSKRGHTTSQQWKSFLSIWETQINATMRHTVHPLELLKLKRLPTSKFDEEIKQLKFVHCWWKCKTAQPLWEKVWQFLINLNIHSLEDQVIPLLCICPRKTRTYVHKKTCTKMFTTALFIKLKKQTQNLGQMDAHQQEKGTVSYGVFIYNRFIIR